MHVEQVDHVVGIENGDIAQPEVLGVLGDEAVRDGVEGAAPHALRRSRIAAQGGRACRHRCGGAAGEGEQQDALGRDARDSSSRATRAVSVRVLPVPAPAAMISGVLSCSTAASCASSNSENQL